jgi:dTDP-glucose 4,6-dehydratase
MKIFVTGGAGFIGSHFIRYMLNKYASYTIYNLDALTYAGNEHNTTDFNRNPNYDFIRGNINDRNIVHEIMSEGIDTVINFAAESHVDRSIANAQPFIETNINGTYQLLEAARTYNIQKFIQVSTDEVYGSLPAKGHFTESSSLHPNNPYSASKASADLIVRSYHQTYKLPVIISRCSNNYGPYQYPEKLIPTMIIKALKGEKLPVYGKGLNIRDWLHVEDHCSALDLLLHKVKPGEVYNIGGQNEQRNIDVVKEILRILNQPESLIEYVQDRPGHDFRYATDASKIKSALGWEPRYTFEEGLKQTVCWFKKHRAWWEEKKISNMSEV